MSEPVTVIAEVPVQVPASVTVVVMTSSIGAFVPASSVMATAPTNAARGTGTLTLTEAATAGKLVSIGTRTYTFVAALSSPVVAGEIVVSTVKETDIARLITAVAGVATATATHSATTAHAAATAAVGTTTAKLDVTSIAYTTAGNLATTTDITGASWSAATLTGGTAGTPAQCLGQEILVGNTPAAYVSYLCEQVTPVIWTEKTTGEGSDVAAAIHAAAAATPASADEWGFWQSVGNVLKKITHANFVTMVKAFLGTAAQATLGTGAGQVPVRGDYDPAGSAAAVQALAVVKTRMLIGNTFDDDEAPQASGYAYYAAPINGKPCFRGTSLAAVWETTAGGRWELRSGANSIWSSPEPVATPDLVTTWTPLVSASTTQPTVVASGSIIDVQQYSESLNAAQPAAIPSIRALGTGALEAMPGDTAVLLATGATAGGTSQPQAFTNGVKLQSATNQIVTGTTTNLSTITFPLSSGAVTVTMPNTTCTVARSASALTTERVVFTTANGVLTDSANLTWNGTILAVTGGMTVSTTLAVTGAFTATGLATLNGGMRSGTGAGEIDVTSASGALLGIRTVEATSLAMSGATVTVGTNIIPAGSYVLGVTVRVMTLVACGSSTFQVGDGTDADAWGSAIAVAAGTASTSANFNITAPAFYAAATNVVLTANGTAFTAGVVKVAVHYITLTGPTA